MLRPPHLIAVLLCKGGRWKQRLERSHAAPAGLGPPALPWGVSPHHPLPCGGAGRGAAAVPRGSGDRAGVRRAAPRGWLCPVALPQGDGE